MQMTISMTTVKRSKSSRVGEHKRPSKKDKVVKRMKQARPAPFDWTRIVDGIEEHGIHVPTQSFVVCQQYGP